MDATVSDALSFAVSLLSRLGAQVEDVTSPSLDKIPVANQKGGFAAAESYVWHRALLEKDASRYDPRVVSRILRGKEITTADHSNLLQTRRQIIADATRTFAGFDAILMPAVPRIAPRIADLEADDAVSFEANAAMLRNPSVVIFLAGA